MEIAEYRGPQDHSHFATSCKFGDPKSTLSFDNSPEGTPNSQRAALLTVTMAGFSRGTLPVPQLPGFLWGLSHLDMANLLVAALCLQPLWGVKLLSHVPRPPS